MQNDQEKRTMLAIGLSLLVYMVWVQWFMPPMTPAPMVTDTTGLEEPVDAGAVQAQVPPTETRADDAVAEGTEGTEGAEADPIEEKAIVIPEHAIDIVNDQMEAEVASQEGSIRNAALKDYSAQREVQPIWSWLMDGMDGEWVAYDEGGEPERLLTARGGFVLAGTGPVGPDSQYRVIESDGYIVATSQTRSGVGITKTYKVTSDPYVLDVAVKFENNSGQAIRDLWVGVADEMDGSSSSMAQFENTVLPIAYVDEGMERLDDFDDVEGTEVVRLRGKTDWLGIGNKYFMSVLAPTEGTEGETLFDDLGDGRMGAFHVSTMALDAGASRELHFLAYMGPKDLDLVGELGHNLDKSIEFGWFGFFARLLLGLLKTFQSMVGNWGVAIVMLTVMVKIIFFPLMQKQFVSSKRMQAIQPQLKALKEKYKDNKDLQTKETMRLFQENKVNPMSGCLPMIIQMPVWFALYNVMLFSVELYGTQFLYLKDLTEVDPYGALPLLVSVLMVLQQKMMPMGSMDPMQQKMMRLMPVMFGVFMFSFPSGLVLYFCINNSLTILQQWFIHRKKDDIVSTPASE